MVVCLAEPTQERAESQACLSHSERQGGRVTEGDLYEKWRGEEGFLKLKGVVELALQKNGIIGN